MKCVHRRNAMSPPCGRGAIFLGEDIYGHVELPLCANHSLEKLYRNVRRLELVERVEAHEPRRLPFDQRGAVTYENRCGCEYNDDGLVHACLAHWRFFYRELDAGRAPPREAMVDERVIQNLQREDDDGKPAP